MDDSERPDDNRGLPGDATTIGGIAGSTGGKPMPDLTGGFVDRYRLVREVGRGGMGVVYEARDEKLDRPVAIKVLPARAIDDRARERFLREARAAAALNHSNIVAIHDAGEEDGRPFLVMEFVEGSSLDGRSPASLGEAIEIARRVCDALEHAHDRGLVHRDLKPGNVLISTDADPVVKLTDMGIALARGAARVTRPGAITGTPTYMAPEQALGKEVDGRADLYSLGVMLYDWATGRPPFEGDDALEVVSQHIHAPVVPPTTIRPDLPAGLESVILRLLQKEPDDRFAAAADVREALGNLGAARGVAPEPGHVPIEGLTRGRMVGRKTELARLQDLWRGAAVEGRSHMALVSGEPGVGKTRLAHEVTATAQLDGALVLTGGCYENEATTPYLPFLEAFRRIVRERTDDDLAEILGDAAGEIALLAPEIESRLGPFSARPNLSPQEHRLRMFDHVARFLGRLATPHGLLFFIDDLQWADHGSLALLHYLLRHMASVGVLFLGTYREVELDRAHALSKALVDWDRERLATRLRLDRLSRGETARMISTLLGKQDPPVAFVEPLHRETEGNPFFVEEIVKALIAEGGLVREGSIWRYRSTEEFVLPQSVKAAIGSRLERVSEPCVDALRTAAVVGKVFDFEELASVARVDEDALLDALDEASVAQLIAPGGGESFRFTHDKIREVLYDELNPIRRRRLHGRIAEGLERLHDRGVGVAVEDLAHHFVESGDYEKGLLYAERAADAARRVFAWNEALEMLGRARECADVLEREEEALRIEEAMGDAAWAGGDLGAAAAHFERVLSAVSDPDRRNALRSKAGEVYVVSGDPRGLEHVRTALAELDRSRLPRETAHATMIQARYHHLAGELQRAAETYRPAIELAEAAGDPDLLVRMYSFLSGTHQHLAEFDESDAAARRAIEIGEADDIPSGIMLGNEFLSENSFFRGRWTDAVRYGEAEEALARECHADERLGWSRLRAFSLHALGRLDEAERLFRAGIEECGRTGDRRLELFLRMGLADCVLARGRTSEADDLATTAVSGADEAELMAHRIIGRATLIRVMLRRGRAEDAAREARVGVGLWKTSGSLGAGLINGAAFAEGLVGGGSLDEAREVLETHRELAEHTSATARYGQNLRVQGLLATREGRTDNALTLLDQAIATFEAHDSVIDLARALGDRAALLGERGRSDDAAAALDRARELLDLCGATRAVLGGSA
jgi:tetratricopeptide (TPR) repeat protein